VVVTALDDATESNRTMGTCSSRIRSRSQRLDARGGKDQVTTFSLDCLTLPDVSPVELVRAASLAGYGSCSLWVQPPAMYEPMLATPSMAGDLAAVLAGHGVAVGNLEVFNLNTDGPIAAYEPALVFGAGLGARTATAIDYGDPRPDIAERLAAFGELCRGAGLEPLVEPISMGNIRTPRDGLELIEAAGVEARLVIDCVHLVRTGCSSESLREIPESRIGHFQMCDGPASLSDEEIGVEATAHRLYPGEGDFPLAEIVAAIPAEVTVGLEVPNLTRQQAGVAAEERARQALESARYIIDLVGPS
jgi:sugar phosphate isomerase/epimerase